MRKAITVAGMLCATLAACAESPTDTLNEGRGTTDEFPVVPQFSPAVGDQVHQVTGAYSQSCSINTGLAFDGTDLLVTCWYHNVIDVLSTVDGSLQRTITVPGYTGLMAAAWDGIQNKLWVCAEHNKVILVDTSDGSSTHVFTAPGYCTDGLAFDGTDNTLWTSGDVQRYLYHWQTDGTLIGTHFVGSNLNGYGNSGIAVGGANLYLANDGGSAIFEVPKDFSSYTLFASFPQRLEDLECDDITFSNLGVGVIWSIDAYDRMINAWEIPPGQCRFGGGLIEVDIDIKPFSWPNSINPKSGGVVPVAILGSETFDVTDVDVTTLVFGPGEASPRHDLTDPDVLFDHTHEQVCDEYSNCDWIEYDANGDGIMDLVSHYVQKETGLTVGDTEACIEGETLAGAPFQGCDAVRMLGG